MTTIEMRVHMDCPGCESKVRSTLLKLKGVDNVDIDMTMQKVTVTGWADQKKVLKKVRKSGRRAELWQFPYNPSEFMNNVYNEQQCNGPINHYAPQPSSSYNYYKHGYDGQTQPQLNPANYSTSSYGYQSTAAFSDDNPNACFIM